MEIFSANQYPGEEIIENNSLFSIRVRNSKFQINYPARDSTFVLFIFICPLFSSSNLNFYPHRGEEPLHSSNCRRAPFFILPNEHLIKPAYFVRKRRVYFGYQVIAATSEPVHLTLKLTIRPLRIQPQLPRAELAQLLLFNSSGSIEPVIAKTIVVIHPKNVTSVKNYRDKRTLVPFPLPFMQSPSLYRHRLDQGINSWYALKIAIGNMDTLFHGRYDSLPDRFYPTPSFSFNVMPQLSHSTLTYLVSQFEKGDNLVFEKGITGFLSEFRVLKEIGTQTEHLPGLELLQMQTHPDEVNPPTGEVEATETIEPSDETGGPGVVEPSEEIGQLEALDLFGSNFDSLLTQDTSITTDQVIKTY